MGLRAKPAAQQRRHKKRARELALLPFLFPQLSAASSNESEAAVVELAAIHPTVSSVAGVADCIRVGEATTIAVV